MRLLAILKRRKARKPPSKRALWLVALEPALGLATMLAARSGLLHDLAVGMFGGGLGSWLVGRKQREDAKGTSIKADSLLSASAGRVTISRQLSRA